MSDGREREDWEIFQAQISGVSEYLASLALVGPNSRDVRCSPSRALHLSRIARDLLQVLSEMTKSDVSDAGFPPRTTKLIRLSGSIQSIAARTSTITGIALDSHE
jgi:hypothetical protein